MKIINTIGLTCFLILLINNSCAKSTVSDDFYVSNLTSGSWTIAYFTLDGTTNDADIFAGYVFRF